VNQRNETAGQTQDLPQTRRVARECREGIPAVIRAALGPEPVLGVSCYDSFERALAVRGVADSTAFGSVFVSSVRRGAVRAPLALFERVREAGMHAVVIGGIDEGNAFGSPGCA